MNGKAPNWPDTGSQVAVRQKAVPNRSMDGIDWCTSNNSTPCALQSISIPVLVVAMGAHYFIRDNEIHYENAASADKDFVVTEGAAHTGPPCVPCEKFPGQYSNSAINQMNYMVNWLNQPGRF